MNWYDLVGKRVLDLILVVPLLLVTIPILILLAILVRVKLGTSAFFLQMRPGLNGKPFSIVKLRTMTDKRDHDGMLLPDAERLTGFGRFLRSTSLDELPELFNVLMGDMSFVGPRPLLMEYLDLYTPEQMRRHEVKPGITGWAQINGRNALSWEEKFDLDIWYVDHVTGSLDLTILWRTITAVLMRKGINHPGQSTMTAFKGTKQLD